MKRFLKHLSTRAPLARRIATGTTMALAVIPMLTACRPDNSFNSVSQVSLDWQPPHSRADGSQLSKSDIQGYVVRYQQSPDTPVEEVFLMGSDNTHWQLDIITDPAAYRFALATIDSAGVLSDFEPVTR